MIQINAEQKARLTSLHGKSFLRLADFTPSQIADLLDLAKLLKENPTVPVLEGKILAMLFMKPSTRTRVSFEVGMQRLGGSAVILSAADTQINRGEELRDTARVLSRYVDGIMVRCFAHSDLEELAAYSRIPVINGLTDAFHPCQAMADLLTIQEHLGTLAGRRLVYIGDGNNMAHSLLFAGAKTGMHVTICCPAGYEPVQDYLAQAQLCALPGTQLKVESDPLKAASGADVLYTDVWASMGQEAERDKRIHDFHGFQINAEVVAKAHPHCLVLHCLPAHRGEEITDEVLEGSHSVVFDQAENRLHAQNAVLAATMGTLNLL